MSIHNTLTSLAPTKSIVTLDNNPWMAKLDEIIINHLGFKSLSVAMLAKKMNISERCLRYKISAYTGYSPNHYIRQMRLKKAQKLLVNQSYNTVAEVAYKVGIGSPSYFCKVFKAQFGHLPSRYFR